MLWGLYRTLKEREREKGTDDEEKVLYTKHSRERFFIVGHRRECARGFLHPRCVGRAREKRPFFFIRSIINRCHWVRPPFLMRHWSDSGAAPNKNLLIHSWRRIRFSFLSPLRFPKNQPANQPTNIYTMLFLLPGIG